MGDRLVTLATFLHATDAETARAVLEMEGVRALVLDSVVEGIFGGAGSGVRLQVLAADAERARAILDRGPLGPDFDASGDGDAGGDADDASEA